MELATSEEAANAAMTEFRNGNAKAFGVVYDALETPIYRFLVRRTRDRATAEELTHETFLRMIEARDRFIDGAPVRPWAIAIARRLVIDHARRSRRGLLHNPSIDPDDLARIDESLDESVDVTNGLARAQIAFERLPESQRIVVSLVLFDGMTNAEAAEALGTTEMSVRMRLHRACRALRAALRGEELVPA